MSNDRPKYDKSHSRVIKMPKLSDTTYPADMWFEGGMICSEDPKGTDDIIRCSVPDFEERINAVAELERDLETRNTYFQCDKRDFEKFIEDAHLLLAEAKQQVHVGLPLQQLVDGVQDQIPVSMGYSGFGVRKSGLVVPT
jgi:hypothetical protein